ncbi:type II toxin-antitoxin system ParD family antitoxin [Rhizobium sp. RU36D]|uniref:type II toxin-antitoxin system ParD family antitoxin n=1 Tax=Rhizobium sp. RU36D TaxID=1907415 RepID=UPI0009D8D4C0|nr:type II toxin-antitoxin system ParD family antitoxin [Rhizobium sp. RU36D]SMC90889.1 antitoxin ParD1/3/4 [Rhizobium sp. RU36D]
MASMNLSLSDPMKAWVERQAENGGYDTASDYIRDLIRKDQERVAAFDQLQAAITKGIESGKPEPFDPEAFKRRMRDNDGAR